MGRSQYAGGILTVSSRGQALTQKVILSVNIPYGEIFKVTSSANFSLVAQYDGWPNGLKVDREGNLIVADYKRGILKIDPKTCALGNTR